MEAVCGLGSEELVNGGDLGSGVDGEQTLTQDIERYCFFLNE